MDIGSADGSRPRPLQGGGVCCSWRRDERGAGSRACEEAPAYCDLRTPAAALRSIVSPPLSITVLRTPPQPVCSRLWCH